jgi:hypothetical protein
LPKSKLAQRRNEVKSQRKSLRVSSALIAVKEPFRSNSFVALSLRVRQSVTVVVGRFGSQGSTMASWQSALAVVRLRFPLSVGVRENNRSWLWLANNAVGSLQKFTCKRLAFCSARTFTLRPTNLATVKATKFAVKATELLTAFPLPLKQHCKRSIVATNPFAHFAVNAIVNLKPKELASAKSSS